MYHQTSPELGKLILNSAFAPGHTGWCGGGIYFALSEEATYGKASGPDSHKGYIITAHVDVGRMKTETPPCDGSMTGDKLRHMGYDSILFKDKGGDEVVIYDPSRVKSMSGRPASHQ